MVLYFTGTGNSKFLAVALAEALQDSVRFAAAAEHAEAELRFRSPPTGEGSELRTGDQPVCFDDA